MLARRCRRRHYFVRNQYMDHVYRLRSFLSSTRFGRCGGAPCGGDGAFWQGLSSRSGLQRSWIPSRSFPSCSACHCFHLCCPPPRSLSRWSDLSKRGLSDWRRRAFGRGRSAGIAGGVGSAGNAAAASSADAIGDWAYGDEYWKGPCRSLADEFGLTPRETEVLEQLAQGRDLASWKRNL